MIAAHVLEGLPHLSAALESGELGIDKVVELARFATPADEARLIRWAQGVSCGAIRRRGDVAVRRSIADEREVERMRFCSWWIFDEGRRFGLEAELPAAQGVVVARALERLAAEVPAMPGENDPYYADARRFLQAHHVVWCSRAGRTELANLVLICFFHHLLVHEGGWSVSRARDGTVRWLAPDGRRYEAGPAPPMRAMAGERGNPLVAHHDALVAAS